jgi:hypothetical protein
MLTIIEKKQLSKNEVDQFLNSGRGSRNTPYREILEELASQPYGFKIKFKVQNGFKFNAPYTTAESMGFTFSYKTVAKNTIEIVKLELKDELKFDGTFTNTVIDIFGDSKKLPVFKYTGHGSMPRIIDSAFKKIGDEAIILANSDKTIRTNANKQGIAVSIRKVGGGLADGLSEYKTIRIDSDNSYVRAAHRKGV